MHEFGNYGRTVSCIKKNLIMRQYISFCHTCCWLAVQGAKLTKLTEPIAQVKILRGKMIIDGAQCPRSDWAVLWFGFGGIQFQICLCPVSKSSVPRIWRYSDLCLYQQTSILVVQVRLLWNHHSCSLGWHVCCTNQHYENADSAHVWHWGDFKSV